MSTASRQTPRFHPGDWVSFQFGSRKAVARVLEDRGLLGVRGGRLYRVQPPLDEAGESAPFEMPEDELESAVPPVRQEYTIHYSREGKSNNWRAEVRIGKVRSGIRARGAVGYSTAFREGQGEDDLNFAIVTVLLEADPAISDPDQEASLNRAKEHVEQARVMADEMFRSRHPRARIVPTRG